MLFIEIVYFSLISLSIRCLRYLNAFCQMIENKAIVIPKLLQSMNSQTHPCRAHIIAINSQVLPVISRRTPDSPHKNRSFSHNFLLCLCPCRLLYN